MDKEKKKNIVNNLKNYFEKSDGVIVTHYLGLNSTELTDLRNRVKEVGANFCVAKNSLVKLATESTDYKNLNSFFSGPTALVFSTDPIAGIKVVKKFSDENEKLKFVSASLDKKVIQLEEYETLAKLPDLKEIRAQIASYLTAPHQQLINVLNAPGTDVVGVLENFTKKKN